ncbi:hypothetical protein DF185_22390 [Marinifilum breve]|uniref:Uncharacterized protein n=1 Tax=Marinifilum breve TaxID=2184082 RepID=A0A2V3ZR69_9BACT|nr:hypothetical protein [Marinifilum breve]PXX95199.1 hypothetical protein DF185_22390 [Marinifilum breve]
MSKVNTAIDMKKLSKNLVESSSSQHAEIKPGGYTTFYGKEGRNYILALTDMDASYPATIEVFDMDWGHLVETVVIEAIQTETTMVKMEKGNGIRVYNQSNAESPGRPCINASLYPA